MKSKSQQCRELLALGTMTKTQIAKEVGCSIALVCSVTPEGRARVLRTSKKYYRLKINSNPSIYHCGRCGDSDHNLRSCPWDEDSRKNEVTK